MQGRAEALAEGARRLRDQARETLEHERLLGRGPLLTLARELAPISDADFADHFAQAVSCVLLMARGHGDVTTTTLGGELQGLLRQLFAEDHGPPLRAAIDDIAEIAALVDREIDFFEDFLSAYDPTQRRRQGVWYTPGAAADHLVAQLDQLAREHLGLALGLADPVRWRAYAERRGIPVPAGIDADDFVVQILDPATGTGVFLLSVLRLCQRTMRGHWLQLGLDDEQAAARWQVYVREDLLPRIHACELMLAPWILTHMRLRLALESGLTDHRWRFDFGPDDRLQIHRGNALDPATLSSLPPPLVILGNPPYERIAADTDESAAWLLRGRVPGRDDAASLFDDLLTVAREHTVFSHHASLYDRYVYFWRWA
ncbi:MAG: hypothetical protein KC431_22965, partial [Myxococcales bacterium]|nr:hypothetical protein [Myxococcales bacterium]